jgi:hypothetical protein
MTKRQRTRARRRAAFLALGELQRGFVLTDEQKRDADENIRLELYRALVAAVGVRMMVLEGREQPACDGAGRSDAI